MDGRVPTEANSGVWSKAEVFLKSEGIESSPNSILSLVDDLDRYLGVLSEVTDRLQHRIEPILRSEDMAQGEEGLAEAKPLTDSDLSVRLQALISRLRGKTARLDYLIGQIDL